MSNAGCCWIRLFKKREMKRFKRLLIGLFVLIGSVFSYGFYLALERPYFEERPRQIAGLDCSEYQFKWYNPESRDTVLSTAWELYPKEFGSAQDLISNADTTWTVFANDTVTMVHWSNDITVESRSVNGKVFNYIVYWSEPL